MYFSCLFVKSCFFRQTTLFCVSRHFSLCCSSGTNPRRRNGDNTRPNGDNTRPNGDFPRPCVQPNLKRHVCSEKAYLRPKDGNLCFFSKRREKGTPEDSGICFSLVKSRGDHPTNGVRVLEVRRVPRQAVALGAASEAVLWAGLAELRSFDPGNPVGSDPKWWLFTVSHLLSGWPIKSYNFILTTKMVFPKSLKFMNSGSEVPFGFSKKK